MLSLNALIPPQYRFAAKAAGVVLVLSILAGISAYLVHKGVVKERDRFNASLQKQAIEKEHRINEINKRNMELTNQSSAYAQQIEALLNEQNEIARKSTATIDFLNSNLSRMRQRQVCRGDSPGGVSEGSNASVHAPDSDESEFSGEFKAFLNAQAVHDEINRIWMDKVKDQSDSWCETRPDIFICGEK
jgi:DNA repair exonuclease SbcCD ATPase subunit